MTRRSTQRIVSRQAIVAHLEAGGTIVVERSNVLTAGELWTTQTGAHVGVGTARWAVANGKAVPLGDGLVEGCAQTYGAPK